MWWREVVQAFLLDDEAMRKQVLAKGATAPFWMAKTLIELAKTRHEQGKFDEAKEAWALIVRFELPGSADAALKINPPAVPPEVKP